MAQYLVSILGDMLLTAPLDHLAGGELPSPNVRLRGCQSGVVLVEPMEECMYMLSSAVRANMNKNKTFSLP